MLDILISTYNGEKFLESQIKSLFGQNYNSYRLLVRDDGSTDSTIKIIKEYQYRYPNKIMFYEDKEKHIGVIKSYEILLQYSNSEYIMFSDQDDVWIPQKIEFTLAKMKDLERKYGNIPLLVHTDLKVVNENLKILSSSFWKYQNLDPNLNQLSNLLVQNNVTGCTMLINRKLKEIALPIPVEAIMHDWWFALVASAFGIINYIETPTVLYRQHSKNDIGAKKYCLPYIFSKMINFDEAIKSVKKTIIQAKVFYSRYKDQLTEEQAEVVYNYMNILTVPKKNRIAVLNKYNLKKYGTMRNLGFILALLTISSENELI